MAADQTTKTVSGYYDGAPYARFVEAISKGMLKLVSDSVPAGCRLIDVCCGTGALAFLCADKCTEVLGVDISPKMIEYAESQRQARGVENVAFRRADAREMSDLPDGAFDWATLVTGLHEMPPSVRPRVLAEVVRVADHALIVDFLPRMPWNISGIRNRCAEVAAGPRHFRNFLDFSRRGGLPALIDQVGVEVERRGLIDSRTIEIYTLARR